MGRDGERSTVSRRARRGRGPAQAAPGRRNAVGRHARAHLHRPGGRRPDRSRDAVTARGDRLKRPASRGVVVQLARSDVKGGPPSRKRADLSIRDGELAAALLRGELALHYQPIVDLRSGECRRVEALLRWRHPRLGLLEPGDFLPFASELIEQIGVWVVRAAAAQWTEWRGLGSGLGIGINVSAPELAQIEVLLEALAPFGSGAVTFELSPGTFASPAARPAALHLAAAGARVALDGASLSDAPGRALAVLLDELK
ncbi:MAG: EAL domain-containing protein, partial [Chloroflexi bacterium]